MKDSFILKGMTAEPNNQLQCTYSMKTEFRWEPYITHAKSKTVRTTLARLGLGDIGCRCAWGGATKWIMPKGDAPHAPIA